MHCSHVQHTSPTERIFIAFASYGDVFQTHWEDDIGPSTTMGYPRLSFYTKDSSWKHQKSQTLTFIKKSDMITWMSLHNAHAIRVKEWCFLSPKERLRLRLPWFRRMTPLDVHLYNLPTAKKAKPLSWIEWKTGQNPKNPPFPSLSKTNFLNFSTSNVMSEVFRMRVHHILSYCTAQDTFFTTLSVEHGWTLYQGQTRSNQPKVADREPSTLISIWSMTFHSYRDGHCHNGFQQVLPIWSITAFQYISGKIKLKTARKCLTLNRKVQHLIWKPKDSDSWFRTLETQFGFGN